MRRTRAVHGVGRRGSGQRRRASCRRCCTACPRAGCGCSTSAATAAAAATTARHTQQVLGLAAVPLHEGAHVLAAEMRRVKVGDAVDGEHAAQVLLQCHLPLHDEGGVRVAEPFGRGQDARRGLGAVLRPQRTVQRLEVPEAFGRQPAHPPRLGRARQRLRHVEDDVVLNVVRPHHVRICHLHLHAGACHRAKCAAVAAAASGVAVATMGASVGGQKPGGCSASGRSETWQRGERW